MLACVLVNVDVNEVCGVRWVTSTIVEEASNKLKRSLRRVHTPLGIASITKGLSGVVYSSGTRRTCVYEYRVIFFSNTQ